MTFEEIVPAYGKQRRIVRHHGYELRTLVRKLFPREGTNVSCEKLFTLETLRRMIDAARERNDPNWEADMRRRYFCLWNWWADFAGGTYPPDRRLWRSPKEIRKTPKAYTMAEIGRLFAAIDKMDDWNQIRKSAVRSCLAIGYFTGARYRHIITAKRSAFHPETRALTLVDSKTFQERVFILPQAVAEVVQAGMAKYHGHPLYPKLIPLTDGGFQIYFRQLQAKAGVFHPGGLRFSGLRKSTATHIAIAAGVQAAAEHLGHTDPRQTISRYIDQRQVPIRSHADVLDVGVLFNKFPHTDSGS